ncbi:MAG: flagellar export protein FliJ [Lachnospiraceae bacterium]|nr:flagellar export protein FliJ [Lachnospiraceae bacterium]
MENVKKNWNPNPDNIYERFIDQLDDAINGEKELTDADQDIKYAIELQRKRLEKKNVKIRYSITPRGLLPNTVKLKQWSDNHYTCQNGVYTCAFERTIQGSGGHRLHGKYKTTFYETKTDVTGGQNVEDDIYVCPNCGAPTPIKDLLNGCPYCSTKFKMDDLFPKISNYYFLRDYSRTKSEMLLHFLKFIIPSGIILFFVGLISIIFQGKEALLRPETFLSLICGPIFMAPVLGGTLAVYALAINLILGAIGTIPMMGTIGSARRFENYMKKYSPEFSFEYLTGKTISLMKMIFFSDEHENLPFYIGEDLNGRFSDIVEVLYRGAMGYKTMKAEGDYVHVTVVVFLENTYENDGVVKKKNEKFEVTLVKNVSVPIQYTFSVKKLMCPNCGGSFDATKNTKCPYCGGTYRVEDSDWAVEKIVKK